MKRWTLEEMAREPRWTEARTLALPGRLRGNAFRAWGLHVKQQFGPDAADHVRRKLALTAVDLPDVPTKKQWYPVWLQTRMVQVIIDDLLGGDALRFQSVFEETTGTAEKALVLAGRMTGPGLVLRMAGTYHASVCDVGRGVPEVGSGRATLEFLDAEIFDDPTWRFANMVSLKTMFESLKRKVDVMTGEEPGPRSFVIHMQW